jgi:protein TonB
MQAPPIMVHLVSPPKVEMPDAAPQSRPKRRVEAPKPVPKPPVTAAITEAPSSYVAAPRPAEAPEPAPPTAPPPPASAKPAEIAAPLPVTPPRFNADYLNNPAPSYPALSRRMGEEGRVVLRVLVNERGLPAEVQLKTSSGFSRLDGVALETVKQWKFLPARRGDQSVSAWVLVPISFSLRS